MVYAPYYLTTRPCGHFGSGSADGIATKRTGDRAAHFCRAATLPRWRSAAHMVLPAGRSAHNGKRWWSASLTSARTWLARDFGLGRG